jgi:hypothetical protein
MMNHEAAMVAFVKLAGLAQTRKQLIPRDKLLLLAGVAACRSGYPSVAGRCRELVLAHNPAHLVKRYVSLCDALRDEAFDSYYRQLSRFCSYERAEHFLDQLALAPGMPLAGGRLTVEEYVLLLLGRSATPASEVSDDDADDREEWDLGDPL